MSFMLTGLTETFDKYAPQFFGPIGFSGSRTLKSLLEMEEIIDDMYPEEYEITETIYMPFGMHLGRVLVELTPGAKWDAEDAETPLELKVVCPIQSGEGSFDVYPLRQIVKYFDDRTDTIYGFAKATIERAKGNGEKNY